jgi:hypothetical protein
MTSLPASLPFDRGLRPGQVSLERGDERLGSGAASRFNSSTRGFPPRLDGRHQDIAGPATEELELGKDDVRQ